MKGKKKVPSLAVYERYDLEERIISDAHLSRWFADVCAGREPSVEIDEVTLALMEGHGLVRKREDGWALGPDGRQFARKLGLIAGPSKFEIDPSVIEKIAPKSERELRKTSDRMPFLEDTWQTFLKTRDDHRRNLLMQHYLPLVRHVAERLHTKLPPKVDLNDLVSAGIFGLMDAINAYDPERGVRFETYCSARVRGAMLDELRSMDWVPRLVRAKAHQLRGAEESLEIYLGRKPSEEELAAELDMNKEEFRRFCRDAHATGLLSLEDLYGVYGEEEDEEDMAEISRPRGEKNKDVLLEVQKNDMMSFLMKGLTRAERLVIVLYYYREFTMTEIAAILGLSVSRVSRMHSRVLAKLKAGMKN